MKEDLRIAKSDGGLRTPLRVVITLALTAALWLTSTAVAFAGAPSHGGPDKATANFGADDTAVIVATFVVIAAIAVAVVVSGLRRARSEQAQVAPSVSAAAPSAAGERRTVAA